MNNLRILIVEDEVLIAEDIKDSLLSFKIKEDNIQMAHNKQEAFLQLDVFKPDLILLDIRMEGQTDGLDIANELNKTTQIPYIFITSHSDVEMVKEIIKTKPAGYITKPFKKSDLYANITLVAYAGNDNASVSIKDGYQNHLIKLNEVIHIKSSGNYIDIYLDSGQRITSRRTLESFLSEIQNENFFKLNKSGIVNLKKIRSYDKNEVVLNSGETLPISKLVYEEFVQKIKAV